MRFLTDENVPTSTLVMLRTLGHDVIHAIELDLQGANDRDLFNLAIKKGGISLLKTLIFQTSSPTVQRNTPEY